MNKRITAILLAAGLTLGLARCRTGSARTVEDRILLEAKLVSIPSLQ